MSDKTIDWFARGRALAALTVAQLAARAQTENADVIANVLEDALGRDMPADANKKMMDEYAECIRDTIQLLRKAD